MQGPYPLKYDWIDSYVGRSPGAYIILDQKNSVVYVGRSNDDLRGRIKQRPPDTSFRFFFEHTPSAISAYNLECIWYHQYNPKDNKHHPQKSNLTWKCLACGQ